MEKQASIRLTRLIQEEVKVQLKRYAMARSREDFINRLVEVLIPALGHHYRVILGTLNNRVDQVEKWQQHQEDFLDQFTDRLQEATKARRLDRRKAVGQASRELMEHDEARRRVETVKFQRAYKLKTLLPLPENAHEDFLARVRELVNTVFPA